MVLPYEWKVRVWCHGAENYEIRYWRQTKLLVKVKVSRYSPGVVQRVGRGTALLFHDRGTRRGWVVSSTPRPHFTPGKDPVPILQGAGWAPEPVWTGGKSRSHTDSIPDRPAHSQSLYRLSYPAHQKHWKWPELVRVAGSSKVVCLMPFHLVVHIAVYSWGLWGVSGVLSVSAVQYNGHPKFLWCSR